MTGIDISTVILIALISYLLGKNHDKLMSLIAAKAQEATGNGDVHWTQAIKQNEENVEKSDEQTETHEKDVPDREGE